MIGERVLQFEKRAAQLGKQLEALCREWKALFGEAKGGGPSEAATSLREAVRGVLSKETPLTSRDVAKLLQDQGLTVGGNTPLSARVQNELSRLKGMGLVHRDPKGAYTPTKELTSH